jgi:hypothetical protein
LITCGGTVVCVSFFNPAHAPEGTNARIRIGASRHLQLQDHGDFTEIRIFGAAE